MDAAFFTLIIDDIVCHDGRALMGQLGGGGPQSIFGYQVCADVVATVGLSTCIGPDCPLSAMEWLERYHVATEGILQTTHSTPRAWQLCEVDGRRTQVWRTRYEDETLYQSMLRPAWRLMPFTLKQAPAYHIGIHPEHFEIDLLKSLKQGAQAQHLESARAVSPPGSHLPWVSAETFTQASSAISRQKLMQLMHAVDVFSPNLVEAESMLGIKDPEQMLEQFLDAGGRTVAIRMGAEGSILARQGDPVIYVPAAECNAVDVTGCGNAFNGALLRSLTRGDALDCAGAWGSAAAASMAESEGIPQGCLESYMSITRQRWMQTKTRIRKWRTNSLPFSVRCSTSRLPVVV